MTITDEQFSKLIELSAMDELALYIAGRDKRMVNTSIIVRALIRFGNKYKDKLIF
jgi:hypothetical protein